MTTRLQPSQALALLLILRSEYSGGFRKSSPHSTSHRDSNQHCRGSKGLAGDGTYQWYFYPVTQRDFPVEWLYTCALPMPLLSGSSKLIGFTMMAIDRVLSLFCWYPYHQEKSCTAKDGSQEVVLKGVFINTNKLPCIP